MKGIFTMSHDDLKDRKQDTVVIDNFVKLANRLIAPMTDTERGEGKTMRLVLDIPVEMGALAAWLDLRGQHYYDENWTTPFDPHVGIPPVHAHRQRARRHLFEVLNEWFHEELHQLSTENHPWLYERPKEQRSGNC